MKKTVDLGDRKITVLGTAHVSEESRKEVSDTIEELEPDLIAVELDDQRLESLRNESGWKNLDIVEAIKDGKGYLLLLNLLLSIYQRKIGLKEGVKPGAEMLEAVKQAEQKNIEYRVIDRDINETFQRLREELGFWDKISLVNIISSEQIDIDIEDLKNEDMIGKIVKELENEFPTIKRVFLDERNSYMTEKMLNEEFKHGLMVVGAAHVPGIVEELENGVKNHEKSSEGFIPWMKVFNYGIPAAILGMLFYSFYQFGYSTGVEATTFWILANSFAALIGAVIARSHVTTWIAAFISSPLTSLTPIIGAGVVAAYVEGRFYPPTVKELEDIAYIESYKELWNNQVGRVILTFVFVSAFGALATILGAGYIASLITHI